MTAQSAQAAGNAAPALSNQPILLRSQRGAVATITMNRPEARNSLSRALMTELQREIDAIAADPSVRVVVIAGNGPGFCAGHDLKEVRATSSRAAYDALFAQCSALMLSITRLPKPVIARVHGVATAAGLQLVATCDLAIAGRAARFATPGVNIGLFCSTPSVALSRAVSRKHALEMLFTGDLIKAETALTYGIVNRVVDDAMLDRAVETLAEQIAGKSPAAIRIGKRAFYEQSELGLAAAYDKMSRVMAENMMEHDAAEGIGAFLEKRAPVWEGS